MFWKNKNILKMKEVLKEINEEMSAYIACFTGHRPQKLPWGFNENDERFIDMKNRTKVEIENAIKKGYHTFLCGMALGFDMMCAELVLELKKKYPHIKLIGAIPCRTQSSRWFKAQQDRYDKLVKQLDDIRCIYDEYVDGCMQERNQYMINNSSLVIALYNGLGRGTKSTIDYAKKQGKEVVVIKP